MSTVHEGLMYFTNLNYDESNWLVRFTAACSQACKGGVHNEYRSPCIYLFIHPSIFCNSQLVHITTEELERIDRQKNTKQCRK